MNTTKHTPGPWYHNTGYLPHYQGIIRSEETGQDIALTYNDELGANARLIAAAPDLLAALVALVNRPGITGLCGDDEARARAAIAKATE